jgi:hypothetical protein
MTCQEHDYCTECGSYLGSDYPVCCRIGYELCFNCEKLESLVTAAGATSTASFNVKRDKDVIAACKTCNPPLETSRWLQKSR